jgi:hypothetical protein
MPYEFNATDLDQEQGWTKQWSPDINPKEATGYDFVQLPDGLRLYCTGPKYGGWLCRYVLPLVYPFTRISFSYNLMIDDATAQQAQIIETDSKITDAAGWTYDLSAQWNIQKGWMFQIDDKDWQWTDTGIKIVPPKANEWTAISIEYLLDYANHTSSIDTVTVDGKLFTVPESLQRIPAKQVGWQPSTIVLQLQQCNNALEGAHSQKFGKISYQMK